MAMFKTQVRLYGKHAAIMQKYCSYKGGEQANPMVISNNDGEQKPFYLFDTRIGIYMVGAMLGIIYKKQAEEDSNKSISATIMVEMLEKERPNLERIYHHMILSENPEMSADAKIKNAFTIAQTDEKWSSEQHRLENYVRGGLEMIDDIFKNSKNYEDVCNGVFKLNKLLDLGEKD